jgi:hypothetical protein
MPDAGFHRGEGRHNFSARRLKQRLARRRNSRRSEKTVDRVNKPVLFLRRQRGAELLVAVRAIHGNAINRLVVLLVGDRQRGARLGADQGFGHLLPAEENPLNNQPLAFEQQQRAGVFHPDPPVKYSQPHGPE